MQCLKIKLKKSKNKGPRSGRAYWMPMDVYQFWAVALNFVDSVGRILLFVPAALVIGCLSIIRLTRKPASPTDGAD